MQLSVYTDAGVKNCCQEPGSLGFEDVVREERSEELEREERRRGGEEERGESRVEQRRGE